MTVILVILFALFAAQPVASAQTLCTDPSYGTMQDVSGTYCSGVSWASNVSLPWYRVVYNWLFPSARAVENGRARVENYYTHGMSQPACTGAKLSSTSLLTAAHCYTNSFWDGEIRYATADRSMPFYRIERHDGYVINGEQGVDLAIAYLHPTRDAVFGAPYFNGAYYDYATEAASCTGLLLHGSGGTECDYGVTQIRTDAGFNNGPVGQCLTPATSQPVGGDSGGPMYAIVSGSPKLFAVQNGTTQPCNRSSSAIENSAWIDARISSPPDLLTMSNGVVVNDFYLDFDWTASSNSINISNTNVSVPCVMEMTDSTDGVEYAGCTFENTTTHKTKSCIALSPVGSTWTCTVTLPRYSGKNWGLQRIWARDGAGNLATSNWYEMAQAGAAGIRGLNQVITGADPPDGITIGRVDVTANPAPGGDVVCAVQAVTTQSVKGMGCAFSSASYGDDVRCFSDDAISSEKWRFCEAAIPSDAPAGSVWTYKQAWARDLFNRTISVKTGDAAFTLVNCGTQAADVTASAGWSTTQAISSTEPDTQLGGDARLEFYARPSVINQDGYVVFSDTTPITSLSQARFAVRFNNAGQVDIYDGSTWTGGLPYEANVWQHIRLDMSNITYPGGEFAPSYSAWAGDCGSPQSSIASNIAVSGTRNFAGIKYWAAWTSQGTLEVADMDATQQECVVTSCLIESFYTSPPAAECGTPPNGCGGTVTGSCGTCSEPTPTCGTDYQCQ